MGEFTGPVFWIRLAFEAKEDVVDKNQISNVSFIAIERWDMHKLSQNAIASLL